MTAPASITAFIMPYARQLGLVNLIRGFIGNSSPVTDTVKHRQDGAGPSRPHPQQPTGSVHPPHRPEVRPSIYSCHTAIPVTTAHSTLIY